MTRLHILLLIAVGLFVLGSISIAPNMTRKPVIGAEGAVAHGPDGRVLTELDEWGYVKKNWFGHLSFVLSFVFLSLVVARLMWNGWKRFSRHRNENRAA